MARRKVSTILDEVLFLKVKREAVREGKQLSTVIAEALEAYLERQGVRPIRGSVVARTRGVFRLRKKDVREVLEQDWLDSRLRPPVTNAPRSK